MNENKSWLGRLKNVLTNKKLDETLLQDLEDLLLQSDLGVETTTEIIEKLSQQRFGKNISENELREFIANEIEEVLQKCQKPFEVGSDNLPFVILMVGVNGSGKTTTLAKLAAKLKQQQYKIALVAADKFRAAAVEQLEIWSKRLDLKIFTEGGGDASALIYDSYLQCRNSGYDVMLIDTAGRLQNKQDLMDELAKFIRVLQKLEKNAPHKVLLVLDATTGNNALLQVESFIEKAKVDGLITTKLDGTARGGILVAIANKYKLPIYFTGVGEGVEDLQIFKARDFARSLVGLEK